MISIGLGLGVNMGGGLSLPITANLVLWNRMGVAQTVVTGAAANPDTMSAWADQTGLGSRDYSQATAGIRPQYQGDGTALFIASAQDRLKTPTFTLAQPYTRYWRVKQNSWTTGRYIADGFTDNTGALMQTGSTPALGIYAGLGPVASNTALAVGVWGSVAAVFNGASSVLQIGSTTTTGDAGTAAAAGATIGGPGTSVSFGSDAQVAEEIIYSGAHDATQRAAVLAYLDGRNPPVVPAFTAYTAEGDSITAGFGVTTAWPALLNASPSIGLTANYAVSGDQAVDVGARLYGRVASNLILLIGTNDQRTGGYGANAAKRAHWAQFMTAMVAWSAMPTKTTGQASTNTSGTWTNTIAFGGGIGVSSSVSGSQRTFSVTGDVAYVWSLIQDGQTGTWKVTLAGVTQATGTTAPNAAITSINGVTYGVVCTRISGLGAGAHSLVFETTNAGLSCFMGGTGVGDQTSFNKVYAGNVISPNATGLATFGVDETNVAAYGTVLAASVASVFPDTGSVFLVDTHSVTYSYQADGLHPNQAGQQQISDKFKSTMGAV